MKMGKSWRSLKRLPIVTYSSIMKGLPGGSPLFNSQTGFLPNSRMHTINKSYQKSLKIELTVNVSFGLRILINLISNKIINCLIIFIIIFDILSDVNFCDNMSSGNERG